MENHYNLMVETREGNLSWGMRQLNGVYTQMFNRRHRRVGHLFQDRYKAILVEKEAHLLELCRHVVLNPVRASLVKRPEEWRGRSSYRATAGAAKKPVLLEVDWVLSQFGRRRAESEKVYRRYVLGGLQGKSPWERVKGQILLGTEDFLTRLREPLRGKDLLKEVPRAQRYVARPALAQIFKGKKGRRETGKDEIIYRAHVDHGYRMGEIAEHLGVHYTSISRAIRRVENLRSQRAGM